LASTEYGEIMSKVRMPLEMYSFHCVDIVAYSITFVFQQYALPY
jgi:hypothetical protein